MDVEDDDQLSTNSDGEEELEADMEGDGPEMH